MGDRPRNSASREPRRVRLAPDERPATATRRQPCPNNARRGTRTVYLNNAFKCTARGCHPTANSGKKLDRRRRLLFHDDFGDAGRTGTGECTGRATRFDRRRGPAWRDLGMRSAGRDLLGPQARQPPRDAARRERRRRRTCRPKPRPSRRDPSRGNRNTAARGPSGARADGGLASL